MDTITDNLQNVNEKVDVSRLQAKVDSVVGGLVHEGLKLVNNLPVESGLTFQVGVHEEVEGAEEGLHDEIRERFAVMVEAGGDIEDILRYLYDKYDERIVRVLGLSLGAYFTGQEQVDFGAEIYRGGRRIDLKVSFADGDTNGGGGKRDVVKGFSKASRRRLFMKLGSLNQELAETPVFVTLTYPNEFPEDFTEYKRHLDTWSKRFARKYPDGFFLWRLEFQKRGAPHFHLLVFRVGKLDKEWLSKSWYEVVGLGDEKHLKAGTNREPMRSWRRAWYYCGKYLGKQDVAGHGANGRVWGIYNRDGFNSCVTMEVVRMSPKEFYRARRILAKATGYSLRGYGPRQGIISFVDADCFAKLFRGG